MRYVISTENSLGTLARRVNTSNGELQLNSIMKIGTSFYKNFRIELPTKQIDFYITNINNDRITIICHRILRDTIQ